MLAIDGPSGSGKGTIGQILASQLDWHFLDSGALYRLLAVAADRTATPLDDTKRLGALARDMKVVFEPLPGDAPRVLLDGEDVTGALRTEQAGERASQVAALPVVRAALLQKQHGFRRPPGLVADGRDMGSKVFPDAIVKVFLTASAEIRAQRRYKQLKDKGFDVNLPRLFDEIRSRDARDAGRKASPLEPAEDAIVIDTSALSIDEVVTRIQTLLRQRGL